MIHIIIQIIIQIICCIITFVCSLLCFLKNEFKKGIISFFAFIICFVFLIITIICHSDERVYRSDSVVVKIINNDPSIKIDTLSVDKNGSVTKIRIKEIK